MRMGVWGPGAKGVGKEFAGSGPDLQQTHKAFERIAGLKVAQNLNFTRRLSRMPNVFTTPEASGI